MTVIQLSRYTCVKRVPLETKWACTFAGDEEVFTCVKVCRQSTLCHVVVCGKWSGVVWCCLVLSGVVWCGGVVAVAAAAVLVLVRVFVAMVPTSNLKS